MLTPFSLPRFKALGASSLYLGAACLGSLSVIRGLPLQRDAEAMAPCVRGASRHLGLPWLCAEAPAPQRHWVTNARNAWRWPRRRPGKERWGEGA